jgi:putative ABC transport system permease protein
MGTFVTWLWRQWRRDSRTAGLRLMALSVLLGVCVYSATSIFVDRMGRAVQRHALQWLGGDVVMVSDQPLPPLFERQARAQGLAVARTATFVSMARAPQAQGGAARLVAVKSVSAAYPLLGHLTLAAPVPTGMGAAAHAHPAPGQVWVDPEVLHALHLHLGDTVLVGERGLRITAVLASEPDRGSAMANIAPRLMMNEADLAGTRLIQPASRVTWRLAVAALDPAVPHARVERYAAWAQGSIKGADLRGVHLETLDNGRPEMQQTLERAMNFVRLVGLLCGLYAAVAVALAMRHFALSRLDTCAVQRVLGASQGRIFATYSFSLLATCLISSAAGMALGLGLQAALAAAAQSLLHLDLPGARWQTLVWGLGAGACVGLGFGLPGVLQLARVPALRVIRRQLGRPRAFGVLAAVLAVGSAAALAALSGAQTRLTAYVLGGFAVSGLVFAAVSALSLRALARLGSARGWSTAWRLSLRQLGAHTALGSVQATALGLSLLALVLLGIVRNSVLQDWSTRAGPDVPDRFVINVVPDQATDLRAWLAAHRVARYDWYPMLRARLVAINHRPVSSADYDEERARRLVDREFNLSYAPQLPADNQVVQGRWRAGDAAGWSVEEGLARTLRLKLGDELTFDLQGQPLSGRIDSLRKVDWTSMHVNFFVMRPVADMGDASVTYIAAFRAPGDPGFDDALSARFPNLTVINVGEALAQVREMLAQLSRAVQFLFFFALAAGLLVLFNALWLTREQRVRDVAVLRALGAGDRLLRAMQRRELLLVGASAGAWAGAAALALDVLLTTRVFHLEGQPHWGWWPVGMVLGALLAWAVGSLSLRQVLRRPVMSTLRGLD